jgi:hypothetical protein
MVLAAAPEGAAFHFYEAVLPSAISEEGVSGDDGETILRDSDTSTLNCSRNES